MFNLVDEPWIPVIDRDNAIRELSLRAFYREAPGLTALALPFALERIAVTRMLVAIMQSALGGPSGGAEKARWLVSHEQCLPRIEAYLADWHHRFELFDAERPFMQQPIADARWDRSVTNLRPDWASGRNVTLFDHHHDGAPVAITSGAALRALLVTLAYQPSGGISTPFRRTDSPLTKPLTVIVEADDLWANVVLNAPESTDSARPTWERAKDHVPDATGTTPQGWLDRATWRSRAVQLIPDDDGRVTRCRIHQHLNIVEGPPFDPFVPIRRKEGEEPMTVRPSRRAVWRDAEVLLRGLAGADAPSIVRQAAEVLEDLDPPSFPSMSVVGQIVAQGKIADVRHGRLPVSAALLRDEERLDIVGLLTERAEVGVKALRGAVKTYAAGLGEHDGWALADRWEPTIWAALAGPFAAALHEIATAPEPPRGSDPLFVGWLAEIRRQCRQAFSSLASASGASPRQARALALGRDQLERGLSKITPDKEERS